MNERQKNPRKRGIKKLSKETVRRNTGKPDSIFPYHPVYKIGEGKKQDGQKYGRLVSNHTDKPNGIDLKSFMYTAFGLEFKRCKSVSVIPDNNRQNGDSKTQEV
jgi:hypothetical protein